MTRIEQMIRKSIPDYRKKDRFLFLQQQARRPTPLMVKVDDLVGPNESPEHDVASAATPSMDNHHSSPKIRQEQQQQYEQLPTSGKSLTPREARMNGTSVPESSSIPIQARDSPQRSPRNIIGAASSVPSGTSRSLRERELRRKPKSVASDDSDWVLLDSKFRLSCYSLALLFRYF